MINTYPQHIQENTDTKLLIMRNQWCRTIISSDWVPSLQSQTSVDHFSAGVLLRYLVTVIILTSAVARFDDNFYQHCQHFQTIIQEMSPIRTKNKIKVTTIWEIVCDKHNKSIDKQHAKNDWSCWYICWQKTTAYCSSVTASDNADCSLFCWPFASGLLCSSILQLSIYNANIKLPTTFSVQ